MGIRSIHAIVKPNGDIFYTVFAANSSNHFSGNVISWKWFAEVVNVLNPENIYVRAK